MARAALRSQRTRAGITPQRHDGLTPIRAAPKRPRKQNRHHAQGPSESRLPTRLPGTVRGLRGRYRCGRSRGQDDDGVHRRRNPASASPWRGQRLGIRERRFSQQRPRTRRVSRTRRPLCRGRRCGSLSSPVGGGRRRRCGHSATRRVGGVRHCPCRGRASRRRPDGGAVGGGRSWLLRRRRLTAAAGRVVVQSGAVGAGYRIVSGWCANGLMTVTVSRRWTS